MQTVAVANLLVTTDRTDPRTDRGRDPHGDRQPGPIGARCMRRSCVDLRTAIYTDPLALHEGAGRYYRSVKP